MKQDGSETLRAAVAAAVGRDATVLTGVQRDPLEYDAFFAHRSVTRLSGIAIVDGARVSWSLIEKRTEGPELAARYLYANGRREFDAYDSGVLEQIGPGIRAPHVYGMDLGADGGITLWLEDVRHEGVRPLDGQALLDAAVDLGGMGGRWTSRRLDEPWYFTGWIDRHAQPEAVDHGLRAIGRRHPAAVSLLGDRMTAVERLILAQPRVRDILESLPRTLCHHDAVGANVFRAAGGTVLIDWESVGPGPVGADLASLLFSSVRRGDTSAATVMSVLDDAVHGYADTVMAETEHVTFEEVRRGFDAAGALRWKLAVDVITGIENGEVARRGSAPDEPSEFALKELLLLVDLQLASAERTLDGSG